MAVKPEDVGLSVFYNKDFEINKIITNNEELNMTPYYAHVDGSTLNIYTEEPNPNPSENTLYDLVTNEITEYKLVGGQCPSENYAVFYLVNKNTEFDLFEDFKVSDFNYVFPCLGKTEIDKAHAQIKEKKDAATKAKEEAERLERERTAAEDKIKQEEAKAKAKADADAAVAVEAERLRLEKEQADEAERLRLAKIESDRLAAIEAERLRLEKEQADEAERLRLAKIESDRLAAVEAERLRLEKIESDRLAAVEAERLRLEKEQADQAKVAQPLHPRPPKEEEDTVRITEMLSKYKTDTSKRKGLPNSQTFGDISVSSACYINAILQMLIDIDEFLNYILFMNESKKQQELSKINTDITEILNQFSAVVNLTENLPDFLIFVYNFLKTQDQPFVNDFNKIQQIIDSLNPNISGVKTALLRTGNIIQMFGFPTSEIGNGNRDLTKQFKDNTNTDKILVGDIEGDDLYKYRYFGNKFGVSNYNNRDYNTLTLDNNNLPSPLDCLNYLKKHLEKLNMFEKKHITITSLKQIFEYVIDGIDSTEDSKKTVIKAVKNVQTNIGYNGVQIGQEEDATAVYNLLIVVFEEELFEKYGLNVKQLMYGDKNDDATHFISPVNLPADSNNTLSIVINDNVSIKHENLDSQKYIVFANSASSIIFNAITIDTKQFNPIGIVKHLGGSSSTGSYGGHYIYYSLKTLTIFNDGLVSKFDETVKQTSFMKCVALYELNVDPTASTRAHAGGSRKTFRVSRRKQVRPL